MLTAAQAQHDNNVINGMFLINGIYASVLFDTGADKCFVSFEFEKLLMSKRTKLPKSFSVEVANGKSITVDSILRDCKLDLNNHSFPIDLIPMKSFVLRNSFVCHYRPVTFCMFMERDPPKVLNSCHVLRQIGTCAKGTLPF